MRQLRSESSLAAKYKYANVTSCDSAEEALSRTREVDIEGGWKVGQPYVITTLLLCSVIRRVYSVPYAALAKVFALIEATTKRLEKTSLLTSFLLLVIQRRASGDTDSLLQAVYLCINRVGPVLRYAQSGS